MKRKQLITSCIIPEKIFYVFIINFLWGTYAQLISFFFSFLTIHIPRYIAPQPHPPHFPPPALVILPIYQPPTPQPHSSYLPPPLMPHSPNLLPNPHRHPPHFLPTTPSLSSFPPTKPHIQAHSLSLPTSSLHHTLLLPPPYTTPSPSPPPPYTTLFSYLLPTPHPQPPHLLFTPSPSPPPPYTTLFSYLLPTPQPQSPNLLLTPSPSPPPAHRPLSPPPPVDGWMVSKRSPG